MARNKLDTNFKNDVFSGNRKYKMTNNSDGTVSFEDVTDYTQEGSNWNAANVNAFASLINTVSDDLETVENKKVIFHDSTSTTGSVSVDNSDLLNGVTYAFIIVVNSILSGENYAQEITCKLGNTIIGQNGNYYKLSSVFSGKCTKWDALNITSYKNGGSWSMFNTRAIFIPLND